MLQRCSAAAAAGPTATCLVVHWTDFPLGYYMDSVIGVSRHENVCVFGAWDSSHNTSTIETVGFPPRILIFPRGATLIRTLVVVRVNPPINSPRSIYCSTTTIIVVVVIIQPYLVMRSNNGQTGRPRTHHDVRLFHATIQLTTNG